jgi:DNA repair protein RadC
LIAIIFGNGLKGKSVLTLSQELLARHKGSIAALSRKSIRELVKENRGIGEAKAIGLLAAIELGIRCRDEQPLEKPRIVSSQCAYDLMRSELERITHEEFWIILLSRSNQVMDTVCISRGGSAATVVDPKILFKKVLEHGDIVAGIILVHNHPSGNLRPSAEDDALTKRITEGGKLLDIRVLDHLIVTPSSYYSYSDEGRM